MAGLEKITQEVLDVCVHALPRRAADACQALILARFVVAEAVDGIPLGFQVADTAKQSGKKSDAAEERPLVERVMSAAQDALRDAAGKADMVQKSLGAHAYKIFAAGQAQEAADAARVTVGQLIHAYDIVLEIEELAIKAGDREKIQTCVRGYRPAIREGLLAARAVVEWFAREYPIPTVKKTRSA